MTIKTLSLVSIAFIVLAIIAISVIATETGNITLQIKSKGSLKPVCGDADKDMQTSCNSGKLFFFKCRYSKVCDCNDKDKKIYSGAVELCDGRDNNCDGWVDKKCIGNDKDRDGYFDLIPTICDAKLQACKIEVKDCDDNNANVHPLLNDWCTENIILQEIVGVDDNCDGKIDGCNAGQTCKRNYTYPNGTFVAAQCL